MPLWAVQDHLANRIAHYSCVGKRDCLFDVKPGKYHQTSSDHSADFTVPFTLSYVKQKEDCGHNLEYKCEPPSAQKISETLAQITYRSRLYTCKGGTTWVDVRCDCESQRTLIENPATLRDAQ